HRGAPFRERAMRVADVVADYGGGRGCDLRLEHRLEQLGLGAECPEECDFVDAGIGGDETRGGAAKAVLRVDARGGCEDASADFMRHGPGRITASAHASK